MTSVLIIVGSLALLVALLWLVRQAAARKGLEAETQRKAVHIGLGLYCMTFPWLFRSALEVAITCALAALILVALRTRAAREGGLGSALHNVGRQSYGELLFALSVALLFFFMESRIVLYLLPLAILTLADAAAALVGTAYGRRTFTIEKGEKSYEGVFFFFLIAWIVAMGLLLHFSAAPRENIVLLSLAVALIGAAIEAESWRGLDNLFVPLGIYLFLDRMIDAPIAEVWLAVGFLSLVLFAAFRVLPEFGVDRHAALAATLLSFVIWTEGGWINVAAPVGAILAHFALATRAPGADEFPRLGALAAVVVIALAWYGINRLTGYNTSYLFNLSFASFGAMALGLAFAQRYEVLIPGVLALWAVSMIRVWGASKAAPYALLFSAASLALVIASAVSARALAPALLRRRYLKLIPAALLMAAVASPVAQP